VAFHGIEKNKGMTAQVLRRRIAPVAPSSARPARARNRRRAFRPPLIEGYCRARTPLRLRGRHRSQAEPAGSLATGEGRGIAVRAIGREPTRADGVSIWVALRSGDTTRAV
jgi:hypothetical protein